MDEGGDCALNTERCHQSRQIVSPVSRLGTMTGSAMNSEEDILPVSDLHACSYYDRKHSVMVV